MVKQYRVIQDFNHLKADSVLNLEEGVYVYTEECDDTDNGYYSKQCVTISPEVADEYARAGILEAVEDQKRECCDCAVNNKLKSIATLIKQLKNTYNQRKENVEKKYSEGKIQTCVKVEHDTVYYNLMKLLNKFEEIINE